MRDSELRSKEGNGVEREIERERSRRRETERDGEGGRWTVEVARWAEISIKERATTNEGSQIIAVRFLGPS